VITVVLAGVGAPARAQEALVLDTYTCAQFLSDIGDRANAAKVQRSLMMISWAAGYAAARQQDGTASLEMIAATLGDVCRNSPSARAAQAITEKINQSAAGDGRPSAAREPSAPPATPAAATPAAAPPSAPAPAQRTEGSFTAYAGRDMEGGDYYRQRGIAPEACERLCRQDARCRAYSYDAWNHFCFLKASIGPLRLEPRSVTYVANGAAISYDDREPIIQRRPQKSFPNDPYLQANAQSYSDCAQRCLKDKRCEAFNFYQATRRCNLIEKPTEYSDARGAEVGIKVQEDR
jgi:hypothetical protein